MKLKVLSLLVLFSIILAVDCAEAYIDDRDQEILDGQASLFRTNIKTTVQLVIHLGVKREGKVFTRNADVEKEMTVPRSTPERVEAILNQILTDIFDAYFSSPY